MLTYVGLGRATPIEGFNYGTETSTSLPINAVGTAQFVSEHDNSGVCLAILRSWINHRKWAALRCR